MSSRDKKKVEPIYLAESGESGRVWDVHVHFIPPKIVEAAREKKFGMQMIAGELMIQGRKATVPTGILEPDALFQWMDEQGIHGALLSVPPFLYHYDLGAEQSLEWTKLLNDGLEEVTAIDPSRLRMLSYIPLQFPELSAREIDKRMSSKSHAGFVIGTSVNTHFLDDHLFSQVFENLDRNEQFLFIHPVDAHYTRLDRFYLKNLLGYPFEVSLAAACLIFSDMLSKYPNIRFCLAHAGGAIPCLIGRWQRGYESRRPGMPENLYVEPRQALSRMWFDCIAHDPETLELLARKAGAHRILLGSDYPFPMGLQRPLEVLADVSPELRQGIIYHNYSFALANIHDQKTMEGSE